MGLKSGGFLWYTPYLCIDFQYNKMIKIHFYHVSLVYWLELWVIDQKAAGSNPAAFSKSNTFTKILYFFPFFSKSNF